MNACIVYVSKDSAKDSGHLKMSLFVSAVIYRLFQAIMLAKYALCMLELDRYQRFGD